MKTPHSLATLIPRRLILGFIATSLIGGLMARADITERPAPANPDAIRVVSANLRQLMGVTEVENDETDPNNWIYRKDICRDVLIAQKADIYCFQECRQPQLAHFMESMTDFTYYALKIPFGGNETRPTTPGNAIFYRTTRLELLESDGFYLSDTPRVPQTGYPEALAIRFANWAKFKDKKTNRIFKVWNAHLDHLPGTPGGVVRGKQIKVVIDAINAEPPDSPQILTGDFNSSPVLTPDYAVYKQLTLDNGWTDTWTELGNPMSGGQGSSNPSFTGPATSNRIDYIMHRGKLRAIRAEIITDFRVVEGVNRYPSDHYFVSADIEFDTSAGAIPDPSAYTAVSYGAFSEPVGIALDATGNLYVADENKHVIKRIAAPITTGSTAATTYAGAGAPGFLDNSSAAWALFHRPRSLVLQDHTWYVADSSNGIVRAIDAQTTAVIRYAGAYSPIPTSPADGDLDTARFALPASVAVAPDGVIYVADSAAHAIRKITASGTVSTFAGALGEAGFVGGAGGDARFREPLGLAIDASGQNLYVADTGNHAIRKISLSDATVNTLAGGDTGMPGWADGDSATARFNSPFALAVASGTVYVADTGNHTIRAVDAATGATRLVTGTPRKEMPVVGMNKVRDGGPAEALFSYPSGITAGAGGMLYVADTGNAAIRCINLANGATTQSLFQTTGTKTVPGDQSGSFDPETPGSGTGGPAGPVGPTGPSHAGGGALSHWFMLACFLLAAVRFGKSWHRATHRK